MTDPRIKTLAKNLIGFSCAVKPGEKILIEGNGECTELVKALVGDLCRGRRPLRMDKEA